MVEDLNLDNDPTFSSIKITPEVQRGDNRLAARFVGTESVEVTFLTVGEIQSQSEGQAGEAAEAPPEGLHLLHLSSLPVRNEGWRRKTWWPVPR